MQYIKLLYRKDEKREHVLYFYLPNLTTLFINTHTHTHTHTHTIYIYIYICVCVCVWWNIKLQYWKGWCQFWLRLSMSMPRESMHLFNSLPQAGRNIRSIFKQSANGLNSLSSFSLTSCHTNSWDREKR